MFVPFLNKQRLYDLKYHTFKLTPNCPLYHRKPILVIPSDVSVSGATFGEPFVIELMSSFSRTIGNIQLVVGRLELEFITGSAKYALFLLPKMSHAYAHVFSVI